MSNPYLLDSADPNAIRFKTANGIGYLVYFRTTPDFFSDYPEFAADVVTFGIAVESNPAQHLPTDLRVGATVRHIVRSFFAENPRGILFYNIDNRDGKQLARKRLFDKWFFADTSRGLERRGGAFGTPLSQTYFTLLFRPSHPERNLVIDCVEAFLLYTKSKD